MSTGLLARGSPVGAAYTLVGGVSVLLAIQLLGVDLSGRLGVILSSATVLLFGIPHGALDIDIVMRRYGSTTWRDKLIAIGLYLGVAGLMLALWLAFPALALIVFLGIAIAHFGADWHASGERFLGTCVGWALIALPALSHPQAVTALFTAIAGPDGANVAALLLCSAVPAVLCTLVYVGDIDRGRPANAGLVACLVAALALPPLVGFAVFFCGLHSPRHFAEALADAGPISRRRKAGVVIAVSGLAVAGGVVMFVSGRFDAVDLTVVRVAFILLSILTLPHFLLEHLPTLPHRRRSTPRVVLGAPHNS